MLLLGVLLIIAGASVALPTSDIIIYDLDEAERHFEEFIDYHQRQYETEEEKQNRFEIFKAYLHKINEFNAQRTQEHEAFHGITKFADYTQEEIKNLSGLLPSDSNIEKEVLKVTDTEYPKELDWSKMGKVTSVKDQGGCMSCWAFSGVANIESQYAIKHNQLLDLSPQQVVDCDKSDGGCGGGQLYGAARYAKNNGGIESWNDYPYVGMNQTCNFEKSKVKEIVSDVKQYQIINEEHDFKKLLNDIGPVAIAVYPTESWYSVKGGIIDSPTKRTPTHAVLLVGYGVEKDVPYWIIKNSWGTSFGNKGYARIRAGNNSCNIMEVGAVTAIV